MCQCRDGEVEEEGGSSEGGGYGNGTSAAAGFTPKIDELEILLESYFVQTDGTLNKLNTVRRSRTLDEQNVNKPSCNFAINRDEHELIRVEI